MHLHSFDISLYKQKFGFQRGGKSSVFKGGGGRPPKPPAWVRHCQLLLFVQLQSSANYKNMFKTNNTKQKSIKKATKCKNTIGHSTNGFLLFPSPQLVSEADSGEFTAFQPHDPSGFCLRKFPFIAVSIEIMVKAQTAEPTILFLKKLWSVEAWRKDLGGNRLTARF